LAVFVSVLLSICFMWSDVAKVLLPQTNQLWII